MDKLNFNPFPLLKTERLLLRQLKASDDKLIFEYQSSKDNFKFVDMPVYAGIEEAEKYIIKMNTGVENNKWIIWAISDIETNRILGTICIWNISMEQSKAELGYGLFPGNLGKGIMSEALKKVIEYGFESMGLKIIEAYTNVLNEKSIALLERNNFTFKSTFTETETSSGEPMEMVIYELKSHD